MIDRPAASRARRRAVCRRWAVVVIGVGLLALWGRQPVQEVGTRTQDVAVGLRVGEAVAVPGAPGVTLRVDAVTPVTWCSGRWWEGVGTVLSGPVSRVDVVVVGADRSTARRLVGDLTATDVRGRPYVRDARVCECQGLCEREPRQVPGGWESPVLLETGLSFAGLRLATPAGALRWDV